jgi:hypothetical protein
VPPAERARSLAKGAVHLAVLAASVRRPARRRALFATDPELISHMEIDQPGSRAPRSERTVATDWDLIAKETTTWAEERGIPVEPVRS